MHIDKKYHNLLESILKDGYTYEDPNRKGVNRIELVDAKLDVKVTDGFPAITTKKLFMKQIVVELIWFLSGDTNIKYLVDNGCNIWNKDAYNNYLKHLKPGETPKTIERFIEIVKSLNMDYINANRHKLDYVEGDLGPLYGKQWTNLTKTTTNSGGQMKVTRVNQIDRLIKGMINTPMSSTLIVSVWNPLDIDEMVLQPCHYGFQVICKPLPHGRFGFYIKWNQRSVDTFLGLPYNIASYAMLGKILECITGHAYLGLKPNLSKVHLYDNSIDAVKEQLSRESTNTESYLKIPKQLKTYRPLEDNYSKLVSILKEDIDKFELLNYESHPPLRVEMLARDE